MSIRVLLVDDHAILRNALRGALSRESEIEVVGEAADGAEAVRLAQEVAPDVVVMDICMPGVEGIHATRQLVTAMPGVKVLALSTHSEREQVLRMLDAGASGYLVKTSPMDEMLRAIRAVAAGRTHLGPGLTTMVVNSLRGAHAREQPACPVLGKRERQILALVADGLSSAQIAAKLHIATGTVEVHRHNILRKLGLHSATELTKYAIRHGFTDA